jgi:hypothetical protein
MQMFYSAAMGGFYCPEVHGEAMPADAVAVPDDLYAALAGKAIECGPDGLPREIAIAPPTFEERQALLLAAVDAHLNAAANAKGYDSILSASLRAALPTSAFHDEGVAFGTWMDAVYAKCYEVLAAVLAGAMPEPDLEQLIPMLPALNLPESKGA